MAGLQNPLMLFGYRDEFVCLGRCGRERFFDEQIKPGLKQRRSNRMVMHCGNGHSCSIEIDIGGEQFFDRSKDRDRVFGLGFCSTRGVRLYRSDQQNTFARALKFTVDTEMIPAESAGSNYGNATIALASDCYAPLPSTARRQRE